MIRPDDSLHTTLPARTQDGRARAQAYRRAPQLTVQATSVVEFRSNGRLLIIGDTEPATAAARALGGRLPCVLLLPQVAGTVSTEVPDTAVIVPGRITSLTGYLGAFSAVAAAGERDFNPAMLLGHGIQQFDLVLDLQAEPAMSQEVPPLGYFAPKGERALESALSELLDLVGEFEKPKFFEYDPDICAHGSSGLKGCSRCLDACPTWATRSVGDKIEVDPHLCQGAGSCATACPSGAIRYVYPPVSDLLSAVRGTLQRYREFGGREPLVLFHDAESGARAFYESVTDMPERVLPFQMEEAGSLGMDAWLCALAYGARRVLVLVTETTAPAVLRELSLQVTYTAELLEALGYPRRIVEIVRDGTHAKTGFADLVRESPEEAAIPPASFDTFNEKRTTLALAIDHLYQHAPAPVAVAQLPNGAPFGELSIDGDACTLCMACVSVCPLSALSDGGGRPALRFREANCVQCGLCHAACPEDAVRLVPRMVFEREQRNALRVLHEEPPFCCVVCGKPFATRSMVERTLAKLQGHWMFQEERARRRLMMCEDCRVADMFAEGPPNVHAEPH